LKDKFGEKLMDIFKRIWR